MQSITQFGDRLVVIHDSINVEEKSPRQLAKCVIEPIKASYHKGNDAPEYVKLIIEQEKAEFAKNNPRATPDPVDRFFASVGACRALGCRYYCATHRWRSSSWTPNADAKTGP